MTQDQGSRKEDSVIMQGLFKLDQSCSRGEEEGLGVEHGTSETQRKMKRRGGEEQRKQDVKPCFCSLSSSQAAQFIAFRGFTQASKVLPLTISL